MYFRPCMCLAGAVVHTKNSEFRHFNKIASIKKNAALSQNSQNGSHEEPLSVVLNYPFNKTQCEINCKLEQIEFWTHTHTPKVICIAGVRVTS